MKSLALAFVAVLSSVSTLPRPIAIRTTIRAFQLPQMSIALPAAATGRHMLKALSG
jgi:hypothetical protein